MQIERREFLGGVLAVSACSPGKRTTRGIFAAGQPAAVLVLAIAPDRLIGWPRRPAMDAIRLLPGADLPQTGALASGDAPASLESVAAARPQQIIDYGDVDARHRAMAASVQHRIGVPYRLIDGRLREMPAAFLEAARLLDRAERGKRLGEAARSVLDDWAAPRAAGPSFYYARGSDGLETGFGGSLATEVLEGGGWRNVAQGAHGIGRVSREQFAAWDPEVVVTLDAKFAQTAAGSDLFRTRTSGKRRRLLLLPDLPFGWIDRPPSINRLLGCAWLAGGDAGPQRAAKLSALLWNVHAPATPMPQWLP